MDARTENLNCNACRVEFSPPEAVRMPVELILHILQMPIAYQCMDASTVNFILMPVELSILLRNLY